MPDDEFDYSPVPPNSLHTMRCFDAAIAAEMCAQLDEAQRLRLARTGGRCPDCDPGVGRVCEICQTVQRMAAMVAFMAGSAPAAKPVNPDRRDDSYPVKFVFRFQYGIDLRALESQISSLEDLQDTLDAFGCDHAAMAHKDGDLNTVIEILRAMLR